ncbi:MAG TPA: cobalamin-dependent protein [Myxococcaceae bacterium]|nr:cobalamin-dependent protein [Myxococcaceae bacterium]
MIRALETSALDPASVTPEAFLAALLTGDRLRAQALAHGAFQRGVDHLYEEVIRPAMVELGALWHANRITVADEHAATAIAQSTVASLYPEFPWSVGGPRALIACVQGERHEFGARMVADLLALDGWHTVFLGADTPTSSLVEMAAKVQPAFVAVSVGLPLHLPAAREAVAALKERLPKLKVLVGGRAVAPLPDAAAKLGADGMGRSAAGAVEVVRGWKQG